MQWVVWGALALVSAGIVVAFVRERIQTVSVGPLPVLAEVKALQLTNQLGVAVELPQFLGKVWVADIIFTRCPGPCATMTRQMADLQRSIPANSPVKFVSLTTDPDFDSPEVLKRYGDRFGTDANRWWFLTGSKAEIANAAVGGLKLTAMEKQADQRIEPNDLFIHSTVFAIVDKRGRLRAVVETQPRSVEEGEQTPQEVWPQSRERIMAIVKQLSREK